MTEYAQYFVWPGYQLGAHSVISYDKYGNVSSVAEFDGEGVLLREEVFRTTYDARGLIMTQSRKEGYLDSYHPLVSGHKEIINGEYRYEYVEYHSNDLPKVINIFRKETLVRTQEFNEKAELINTRSFWGDGSLASTDIYDYNENGNILLNESASFFSDSVMESKGRYYYDGQNRLMKTLGLAKNYEYEYDQLGRVVKRTNMDRDEIIDLIERDEIVELTYDEEGNLVKLKESGRSYDGAPFEYKLYTFGDYDRFGNPTHFTISENGKMTSVVERKIEYYE